MSRIASDIEAVLKKYPGLHQARGEYVALEGTFTAHSEDGAIEIDDYEVRITIMSDYPFSFPKVEEIGGKIQPRNATRHINVDGTLCLANPVDEARVCRKGITLTWFLEKILNPHFCREYVRDREGYYITGERSHRTEGIWESYYEIFGNTDKAYILEELGQILSSKPTGRNAPCYCGSGKKYKLCHAKVEPKVLDVGRSKLSEFYQLLKSSA